MTEIKAEPEHWSRLRSLLLDPLHWPELWSRLEWKVLYGQTIALTPECTGFMPDTIESEYVCANAGPDFWQWCLNVAIARTSSDIGKDLSAANLNYADLSGIALRHADVSKATLRGANLRDTELCFVIFVDADLEGADLEGADLRAACLFRANLQRTNLRRCDLSETEIVKSDLRHADLDGSNLGYANLSGADLCGANLKGANVNGADFGGAKYDRKTVFPDGFDVTLHGMIRVDESTSST